MKRISSPPSPAFTRRFPFASTREASRAHGGRRVWIALRTASSCPETPDVSSRIRRIEKLPAAGAAATPPTPPAGAAARMSARRDRPIRQLNLLLGRVGWLLKGSPPDRPPSIFPEPPYRSYPPSQRPFPGEA